MRPHDSIRQRPWRGDAQRIVTFAFICAATLVTAEITLGQSPPTVASGGSRAVVTDAPVSAGQGSLPQSWQQRPEMRSNENVRHPAMGQTGQDNSVAFAGGHSQPGRVMPASTQSSPATLGSASRGGLRPQQESSKSAVTDAKYTPLPPPSSSLEVPTEGKGSSTLQNMFSVGSSLLIVIGLFLGVAWCYRKTAQATHGNALPSEVVSVLGRTPLAARQNLMLLRFGSKLVLVSMVQGEARTLSEITDPLEVDKLAGICESKQPGSITESFRSVLAQGATQ